MHDALRAVVENGGNIEITSTVPIDVIRALLAIAAKTDAQVTILASSYPVETLLELAKEGRGNLTVKFD
jgi:hypothetical protein